MDAVELFKVVLRRWYVVLPVLLLAAGGAFYAGKAVTADYEARAALLLLGPSVTPTESGGAFINPYRSAGTTATADALDIVADSATTRLLMAEAGFEDLTYEVRADNSILEIVVVAKSSEQAIGAVQFLQEFLENQLTQRQDAVQAPQDQRLAFDVLSAPSTSTEIVEGVSRIRVAVLGAGGLLAMVLAVTIDRLARRRPSGSRRTQPEETDDPFIALAISAVRGEQHTRGRRAETPSKERPAPGVPHGTTDRFGTQVSERSAPRS